MAGILATYIMFWSMVFSILESNVRLTPIFYMSLLFVTASSLGSILMSVGKINNSVIRKITTRQP
jgi:hypothetical protein